MKVKSLKTGMILFFLMVAVPLLNAQQKPAGKKDSQAMGMRESASLQDFR